MPTITELREDDYFRTALVELLRNPVMERAITTLRLEMGAPGAPVAPVANEEARAHQASWQMGFNRFPELLFRMADAPKLKAADMTMPDGEPNEAQYYE
jgi:hypothetical protein